MGPLKGDTRSLENGSYGSEDIGAWGLMLYCQEASESKFAQLHQPHP